MMTSVLLRLTDDGEPLRRVFDTLKTKGMAHQMASHQVMTLIVASFLSSEYKEEKAVTEVTKESIRHTAMHFLKDILGIEDQGQLESMSETVVRLATTQIRGASANESSVRETRSVTS